MTENPTDDVLRDLEAALAVTPSREFAEGVRARIRDASARRRVWPVWTMAALAAAAGVVLTVLTRPHRATTASDVSATTAHSTEPAGPAPVVTLPPVAAAPTVAGHELAAISRPRTARGEPRPMAAPEVLVPRDQAVALQTLVAGLSDGTIDAESLATPPPDASMPLAPAAQIEIVPIVIPPIDGRAPGPSGGNSSGGIR